VPGTGPGANQHKIPRNIDVNSDPFRAGKPGTSLVTAAKHPLSTRTLAVIALLAALLLLVAAVPVAHLVGRRSRHAHARDPGSRAHAAWDDVVTDAADLGLRTLPSDSPRAAAARLTALARLDTDAAAALRRLAAAEERARYAATMTEIGNVELDARLVCERLPESVGRWIRLRARVLPPSTVHAGTDWLADATGRVFDLVDRAVAWLSALLRSPLHRTGG
jgi:hypothetical protein